MWPSYFLFNKILKTEDEDVSNGEHSGMVEPYPCEHPLPCSHFVEVPHINQQDSWDCGLACVLMVFRTLGIDNCDIQTLAELCHTNSIWTVDLAFLLQKFSISFSYYTVTFGANPNYSGETFYKEQLPNDLERVDNLFQKALEAGINIQRRSISREEICFSILSGKYIAIVLVDQYKLRSSPDDVFISDYCVSNSGYTGHYVVICGYDTTADEFEIRDPACSRLHYACIQPIVLKKSNPMVVIIHRMFPYLEWGKAWLFRKNERISSTCLEEARKSFGTDEDLLLISLKKSGKQNRPGTHQ